MSVHTFFPPAEALQGAVPVLELRAAAREAWEADTPHAKVSAARALGDAHRDGCLRVDAGRRFEGALRPGRPTRPRLVHPRTVPPRGSGSELGRAALLHAIAHIEFNAIDLALDAIWRFEGLPLDYYLDWTRVVAEEALHFSLLQTELAQRGHAYGDFDAHDGLWELAIKTHAQPLARMALVPRLMEARGLDVTPQIRNRLQAAGDTPAVAILDRILADEIQHVAIGNRWYRFLCEAQGLDPLTAWDDLAASHEVGPPRPPFNRDARLLAGFTEVELARWEGVPQRQQGSVLQAD